MIHFRLKEIEEKQIPKNHRPFLDSYTCTNQDKARRLELSNCRPGRPSDSLLDAVFHLDEEDFDLDDTDRSGDARRMMDEEKVWLRVKRKRGEMPWFEGMMVWGYPPGYIAEQGLFLHFLGEISLTKKTLYKR